MRKRKIKITNKGAAKLVASSNAPKVLSSIKPKKFEWAVKFNNIVNNGIKS